MILSPFNGRKHCKRKLCIYVSYKFYFCETVNAKGLIAVEWAPFVKMKGINDQQLIVAADKVNLEFLIKQPAFLKRELIKKVIGDMPTLSIGVQKRGCISR
jgi:hypothetical protein